MIYFCIPAHDEAATVGLVMWKIRRVLEGSTREYQFLVGDDASTDTTQEVLASYGKALPLTVVTAATRAGYAATVERLLREALKRSDRHKRDVAVLIPADFSADPGAIPDLLRPIDSGADIVVAEATLSPDADRWTRRVRRWAPRLLGRRARIPGVSDVVSGFAAFRLITLRNAFRDSAAAWFTVDGWAANAQLLTRAASGARRVETISTIERADRHPRALRHTPWQRIRQLWAARRHLTPPPPAAEREPA